MVRLLILSFCLCSLLLGHCDQKVLICGVCRNVAHAVSNTVRNCEKLGQCFSDYAVIIYENNSQDNTVLLFEQWVRKNPRVSFVSENLSEGEISPNREVRIANARNRVLSVARNPKYADFDYLIMVDLDFVTPWPIREIAKVIQSGDAWDCVSANGRMHGINYWDRVALRSREYPFGFELLGENFWLDLGKSWFIIDRGSWKPVFSAFGGLAIYKTKVITQFAYSGHVTEDLRQFYEIILGQVDPSNRYLRMYLDEEQGHQIDPSQVLVNFVSEICCEHVPLHAAMYLSGFNRFYINPQMTMLYQ